jgi:hypothetical protein
MVVVLARTKTTAPHAGPSQRTNKPPAWRAGPFFRHKRSNGRERMRRREAVLFARSAEEGDGHGMMAAITRSPATQPPCTVRARRRGRSVRAQ